MTGRKKLMNVYHGGNMADQPLRKEEATKIKYSPSILAAILGYTLVWFYSFVPQIINCDGKQTPLHPMASGYYIVYFLPFVIGYWIYIHFYRYLFQKMIPTSPTQDSITKVILTIGIIQYVLRTFIRIDVNEFLAIITTPIFVDILLHYVWRLWQRRRRDTMID